MAVSTVHKLDKIILPSAVEFSQIHSARWGGEITSMIERPAGHVHPMFRSNQEQKPVLEFTTSEIGKVLSNIGVGGAALGSTASYFKKATQVASEARAGLLHQRVTIASSLGYWTTIRLPHNGRGEATVMLVAAYDGVNDPFVHAGTVALSGTLSAADYFGAGPVSLNGVAIPGIKEIEISSGVRLLQEGAGSEQWDTFVGIEVTEPIVTIRTLQMVNWATLGLVGTALNGTTGLAFYARKFSSTGRVANATASHILFTVLNGSALPVDSNGENSSPITDTLRVECISGSDSVAPLTGTVGSAIT